MAAETAGGYIVHHLTNLTFGKHPVEGWTFAYPRGFDPENVAAHAANSDLQYQYTRDMIAEMGFWAIHVDTMLWSMA